MKQPTEKAMSDSPYIIDGTKENFAEIVNKSQELPRS